MQRRVLPICAPALTRALAISFFLLAASGCSGGSANSFTPAAVVPSASPAWAQPTSSAGAVSSPSATSVAVPSPIAIGDQIAYGLKGADGSIQIATVGSDGSNERLLTSGTGAHLCAAISADGGRIAYCSDVSGNFEIWSMDSDGTAQTQLTHLGGTALFPDFSPSGHLIAFGGIEGSDRSTQVQVVDATTGGSLQTLTSCAGQKPGCSNDFPVWSPDGKQIAFTHAPDSDADGNRIDEQVWVMDADGTNAHALTTSPPGKGELPEWSPDGSQIAYESGNDGSGGIWVMQADGSKPHQLTGCAATDPTPCPAGGDFGPAWSPDGHQIAFIRDFRALGQEDRPVMVMNADGSNQHRLTAGPVLQYVPAW